MRNWIGDGPGTMPRQGPPEKLLLDRAKLLGALERMERRVRELGLERYDPSDILSHPFVIYLTSGRLRRYAGHLIKLAELYMPVVLRRLARTRRELVPTTLFHLGMTYLYRESLEDSGLASGHERADEMCRRALEISLPGEYLAWRHPYAVHALGWRRAELRREGVPPSCAHHTARLGLLLLRTGLAHGRPDFLHAARSAANAMLEYHRWHHHEDGSSTVSYYPDSDDEVINTGAEVAALLALLPGSLQEERDRLMCRQLVRMLVLEQRVDGGWDYVTRRHARATGASSGPDNHHQAMILGALVEVLRSGLLSGLEREEAERPLKLGLWYYLAHLCRPDGFCLHYPGKRRQSSIAGYCEGVLALLAATRLPCIAQTELAGRARGLVPRILDYVFKSYYNASTGDVACLERHGKTYDVRSIRWGSGLLMQATAAALLWPKCLPTQHVFRGGSPPPESLAVRGSASRDGRREVFRTSEVALTAKRRTYVYRFLEALGFGVEELGERELLQVFLLLSRAEEYATRTRHNGHNWELAFACLERRDQHLVPVIETWIREWARDGRIVRGRRARPLWPDGKRFCLCLTHDIDNLQEYPWLQRLRALPYQGRAPTRTRLAYLGSLAKQVARRATVFRKKPSPPLDLWLEAESRFGFRSTCLFAGQPGARPSWEDIFYRYGDMIDFEGRKCSIGDAIRAVAERGWDVGLHGSCSSHANVGLLRAEKMALERVAGVPISSTRQHHLMCDVRVTPRAQAEAGFSTDSTFGSNFGIGFRCGTGLPFFMYDIVRDEELSLLQVPLVVQDIVLARNTARDEELMVGACVALMERVAKVDGAMTLLWHNDYRRGSIEFRSYERVLESAACMGAWGCSMRQLNEWWRRRAGTGQRRDGVG